MKAVGIALLFGLCTLFGFRIAEKKTARLKTVRALLLELQAFSDAIMTGRDTLQRLSEKNGRFYSLLSAYLRALDEGKTEREAAELACEKLEGTGDVQAAFKQFLTGLSGATGTALRGRIQTLTPVLMTAGTAAETEAGQGRVFRCIGVLIGAGLAILLM